MEWRERRVMSGEEVGGRGGVDGLLGKRDFGSGVEGCCGIIGGE